MKSGAGSSLRAGGCLIAILALIVVLASVSLFYRPPAPPPATPYAGEDDGDGAAATAVRPGIRGIAVSPDGTLVAYGGEESRDGRFIVQVRRIEDGRFADRETPAKAIGAHAGPIRAIRFLPGTRDQILTASEDGTIGWWNVETGEKVAAPTPPPGPVAASAGSDARAGGGVAAPGGAAGTGGRGLLALDVSPDGRHVAAGGWSGDILIWDMANPSAPPAVLPATPRPPGADLKTLFPTGHVDEIRTLLFVPGDPPMLLSGGGEGLVVGWDPVLKRPGRAVTLEGKGLSVRDLLMRQIEAGRDKQFAVVAFLASPGRSGVLASDFRGCVYLLETQGPCRGWWLGDAAPGTPPACARPVLKRERFCPPLDSEGKGPTGANLGLAEYPGLGGGFVGIAWNERMRVFRATDVDQWREFEGSARRREWMCGYSAGPGGRFIVTGGQAGYLRLYLLRGEASSPEIVFGDEI